MTPSEIKRECIKDGEKFRIFGKKKAYALNTFKVATISVYEAIQSFKRFLSQDVNYDRAYINKLTNYISGVKELAIVYRKHRLFHAYKIPMFDSAMTQFLDESVKYLESVIELLTKDCELDIRKGIENIIDTTIEELYEEESEDENGNTPFKFKAVPAGDDLQKAIAEYTSLHHTCYIKRLTVITTAAMLEDVVISDITDIMTGVDLWKSYKKAKKQNNTISRISSIKFLDEESLEKVVEEYARFK